MTDYLWEILVPTVRNDGRPFRLRYHRVWDEKVRDISGGITIMKPAKGEWVDSDTGDLYADRTIPVRFVATREEMKRIVAMSCVYYDQLAMMCYKVSDDVTIMSRAEAEEIEKAERAAVRRAA